MAEYIDRYAVMAEMQASINAAHEDNTVQADLIADAFETMQDLVFAFPAADVRPVVRGRWIISRVEHGWNCAEYPTHCKCSKCQREVPFWDSDNYCPNCGAQMEEEEK